MVDRQQEADDLLQRLATAIYSAPLSGVRDEPDYPRLDSPLHVAVLLIDCDTEIEMEGMLGFLENSTGQHLAKTREALGLIGAPRSEALLESVEACMGRHQVTWERLEDAYQALCRWLADRIDSLREELERRVPGGLTQD